MRRLQPHEQEVRYPSGRTYRIDLPRWDGRICKGPGCGQPLLSRNPRARYCNDPVCRTIAERHEPKRKRTAA